MICRRCTQECGTKDFGKTKSYKVLYKDWPRVIAKVFTHNGVQTVYLPADARFPITVKEVMVRIRGKERIITPIKNTWDHFFLNGPEVTSDFFKEADDVLHTECKE